MAVVLIIAAVIGVSYYVSLRIWPYANCRRCEGGGTNAGSNRKRWGRCGRCGGTGRRLRFGARERR